MDTKEIHMLAYRILDRLDSVWVKALEQADLPYLAGSLAAYQTGYPITDDAADAIAEQVFIALLYRGEAT
jgi:hypothetical protein